jgi:uncharacterized NAD(P)/FAD-binding protein YdhS
MAAKIEQITHSVSDGSGGAEVRYRRRGRSEAELLHVAKVVPCTGMMFSPHQSRNPVLQTLLRDRLARPDALGIGLDVTSDCAIIDARGRPSPRLFAVGPLTRGRFWETIAIPDIRMQCADLAVRLLHGVSAKGLNSVSAG